MSLTKVSRGIIVVILLVCSNAFMNTAWYLHLKVFTHTINQIITTRASCFNVFSSSISNTMTSRHFREFFLYINSRNAGTAYT